VQPPYGRWASGSSRLAELKLKVSDEWNGLDKVTFSLSYRLDERLPPWVLKFEARFLLFALIALLYFTVQSADNDRHLFVPTLVCGNALLVRACVDNMYTPAETTRARIDIPSLYPILSILCHGRSSSCICCCCLLGICLLGCRLSSVVTMSSVVGTENLSVLRGTNFWYCSAVYYSTGTSVNRQEVHYV
jgi:hypothetical protein